MKFPNPNMDGEQICGLWSSKLSICPHKRANRHCKPKEMLDGDFNHTEMSWSFEKKNKENIGAPTRGLSK